MTDKELEIIKRAVEDGVYVKRLYPRKDEPSILKCIVKSVDFRELNKVGITLDVFGCIGYHFNWREDEYIYDEKYLRDPESHKLYSECYSYGWFDNFTLYLDNYGKATNDYVCWALTKEELETE